MPAKPDSTSDPITDYRHSGSKRKNIPPAGLASQGTLVREKQHKYAYNPHLPPRLRFDATGRADRVNELLEALGTRELNKQEIEELQALAKADPWLEWSGKREEPDCVVDPVALQIHERVSAQAILKVAAREDVQRSLFADPAQELQDALRFYDYDIDWAKRLILGDSLPVMASLARREALAGKVQMVYCDFPYGIKYASNFQSEVADRNVQDRETHLTREVEMVKAYRDTWTLGFHSYLRYVRDRLTLMKELLSDSGSIFIQIGEDSVHLIRSVLDEIFQSSNFVSLISYSTTSGVTGIRLSRSGDYIIWYAKNIDKLKYRQLYRSKDSGEDGGSEYKWALTPTGEIRNLTKEELSGEKDLPSEEQRFRYGPLTSSGEPKEGNPKHEYAGLLFQPSSGNHWKTNPEGIRRLRKSGLLVRRDRSLSWLLKSDFYPVVPMNNNWLDTKWGFDASDKRYVVQTNEKAIERCVLMATDPGDLVLDPTIGSGTTAAVAERWARRWIGIDVSRVAVAIARQRLLVNSYDYYRLRPTSANDVRRNPDGPWMRDPYGDIPGACTFQCETVPHITLKSIAQNQALDSIFERYEPVLRSKLEALNSVLAESTSDELRNRLLGRARRDLTTAQRKRIGDDLNKLRNVLTTGEWRRWILPPQNRPDRPYQTVDNDFLGWYEWEVPYESDPEWPNALQLALVDYRRTWREKTAEVNKAIAARGDQEELVNRPIPLKGVTRVTGPFTVEGIISVEESISLDPSPVDEFEADLETFGSDEPVQSVEREPSNAGAYVDRMIRLLRQDGVRFTGGTVRKFTRLERSEVAGLHGEGEWEVEGAERQIGVVLGPQYGALIDEMVQDGQMAAASAGVRDLVFAAWVRFRAGAISGYA